MIKAECIFSTIVFSPSCQVRSLPPPFSPIANASTLANAKSLRPASLLILLFTPQPVVARSARANTPEKTLFFINVKY